MKETELSEEVARREGGAKSIDIAQIKEIQRNLLDIICTMENDEIKFKNAYMGHQTYYGFVVIFWSVCFILLVTMDTYARGRYSSRGL